MKFFTKEEFLTECPEYTNLNIPNFELKAVSEIVMSQVGLRYRNYSWNEKTVPQPIKEASIEQLRFMIEHDIPRVDTGNMEAGNMKANIRTDYSTLTLRILANHGYWYRGNPINYNMSIDMPFGVE